MARYLGPKTHADNLATQGDLTSGGAPLSDATPDALTPDQSGAAGTAVAAARADHQHEILAASAGTITGTNAEGTSTSFARADHDHEVRALSFSAYNGAATFGNLTQSIILQPVPFTNTDWNTVGSAISLSGGTAGRFTPNKAGIWRYGATILCQALGGAGFWHAFIRKNGSDYRQLALMENSGYPTYPRFSTSLLIEANGTTDYFDLVIYHTAAATRVLYGGSSMDATRIFAEYIGTT